MNQDTWTAVDELLAALVIRPDGALDDALAASRAAGLPEINVSPAQGKLLYLLARLKRAKNILEIGTLGGYSTIWLARGLSTDGRLVTLEYQPKYAEIARQNLARAGLGDVVDIRVGRAIDALPQLEAEGCGPFDLVFIDADKVSTPDYFQWALRLTRPGSLIIVDNIVRKGAILDGNSSDESVQGIQRFLQLAAADSRIATTAIQTVGIKGYDGLTLSFVLDR